MKKTLKIAIYPVSGLIVFVLALAVMLALKGDLDADVLRGVPGAGKNTPDDDGKIETVATMRYFSSEELTAMLKEARELKSKSEEQQAGLAQREQRLRICEQNIAKARLELLAMRSDLDSRKQDLRKAEKALESRVTLVDQAEAAGLRRSAMIHESMDPKKAAAALMALDADQAAGILAFVQEKKAARILQEMEPESASDLLTRIRKVKNAPENAND